MENIMSIAAAQVQPYITEKIPSKLIPFKGNFPLLPVYKEKEYYEITDKTPHVSESPQWVQDILLRGQTIFDMEKRFENYLRDNNISLDDFKKKSSADKSTDLMRFMNANCIGLESLNLS